MPKQLTYVDPTVFAGSDGCPMTLSHSTESQYLSVAYPIWTIDILIDLGMTRLTRHEFLRDLAHMITEDPDGFHGRSAKWHEDLAAILLPQVDVPELKTAIRQLSIIPLLDGTWSNSEIPHGRHAPEPAFWPSNIDLHGSEAKLPLSVINSELLVGDQRRKLFERLGIITLDAQHICDGIIAAHTPDGPGSFSDPSRIGTLELISHALLLHRESWAPIFRQEPKLWLVSADGHRYRGSELYVMRDAKGSSQTSGVHEILEAMSPRLHGSYFRETDSSNHSSDLFDGDIDTSAEDFLTYMTRTFRIATVPRLVEKVYPGRNACSFSLSREFRTLFHNHHASDIFQLILDNWKFYSRWIEFDELHRHCQCPNSRANLLNDIREAPSQAEHGLNAKILDTVLPDVDPFVQVDGLPLCVVNVLNYEDLAVRYRLQYLGVITRKGYAFYLKCLHALQKQQSPSEQHIAYVYQQIQAYYAEGKDEIE